MSHSLGHTSRLRPRSPHSGHSHSGRPPRVTVDSRAKYVVLALLAAVAVATIVGLLVVWPAANHAASSKPANAAIPPGTTFPTAEVLQITPNCPDYFPPGTPKATGPGDTRACQMARVRVDSGALRGKVATMPILWPYSKAGLQAGDHIELMVSPNGSAAAKTGAQNGEVAASTQNSLSVFGVVRNGPVLWWLVALVVVVVAVGALRGALSLLALAFTGLMFVVFVLPTLVGGAPGPVVGLVAASAIMFVVLYLAHGPSLRTSVALLGTLFGVVVTAGIAQWAVASTHLTGAGDEAAGTIATMTTAIDFRGLVTCAIIIAGLGVLNDVTITQASAVWELRSAAPQMSRRSLFAGAMRIGRDHIASTIYTIVFAYAGTALSVLLVLYLYQRSAFSMLTYEDVGTEVVRTICSAIGLVLAVPITTAVAVAMLPASTQPATASAVQ